MLVEFKGQDAIINLDQVSFITKSDNEETFSIHFNAVIGRNSDNGNRAFSMSDPTIKQFATWTFKTEHERDSALQKIIFQSNGIRLGFEGHDSYEV